MSKSRAQVAAIEKADQKRLAAINGRTPSTALRRLSARELFREANARREASRPVIGQDRGPFKLDKSGRKRYLGKPTPSSGSPRSRTRSTPTARGSDVTGTRSGTLLAATLSVGDKLVKADTSSWGDLLHTIDMEVVKITASRITVRHSYGMADLVIMVKDGVVTDRIYGRSDRIFDRASLFTPDDADLALLIEKRAASNLMADATSAVKQWLNYRSDRTKAREAVAKIQEWIDAAAVIDAKENPL